jgi:putative membrane protein
MKFAIAAGSLLAAAALVLGGGVAAAQSTRPPPPNSGNVPGQQLSEQDRTWMMQIADASLAEISAGQLAVQRATTPAIRQTAQTIVNDHQQGLTQLGNLAQRYSVTLPSAPNDMQQQHAAQLQSLTGTEFDRTYLQDQITGHQQAIAQTQQEISAGSNPDVQQFARTTLTVLHKHLQLAQTDAQQLAGTPPSGVNAGTGGAAAPWASAALVGALLGGGSLLIAAAAALLLARRRQV